jgi:predicted TIM-barrel fold metal-dependent hydrolase
MMLIDSAGWLARRGLPVMLFSGVFERHPGLRFVLTEQNGEWWSATMREYDSAYISHRWQLKDEMPKKPSEYCASNVYIGGSYMAPFEAEMAVEQGYAANVMWGSDYPHAEGTFQYPEHPDEESMTHLALRNTFAQVENQHTKMMVSDNAIRCYDLDADALRPIARAINAPTLDELSHALAALPQMTECRAFRTLGPWG